MYIIETTKTKASGIHIGDNIHNQDQVITPHSFKIINVIAKSPVKPIPADVPLFDELLFELFNLLTPFIYYFLCHNYYTLFKLVCQEIKQIN